MRRRTLTAAASMVVLVSLLHAMPRSARDWNIVRSADSLDLFIKGRQAGSCIQSCSVDSGTQAITVAVRMTIDGSDPETPSVAVEERRIYGFDGRLKNASQDLAGGGGTTSWRLTKDRSSGWKLSTTAAGKEKTRLFDAIGDNLEKTYLLCRGVKTRTIRVGDAFRDTNFELESGTTVTDKTVCIALPGPENGFCWVFLDSLLQREDTLRIDTSGSVVSETLYPFTAEKKGKSRGARASFLTLIDALAIPADRAAHRDESIALVLDSSSSPDSSVLPWYRKRGSDWVLSSAPGPCSDGPTGLPGAAADSFTAPTVTMQSDDPRIRRLADSIVTGEPDRCDSIDACYRWVYTKLEKKITPTFSNAIETLEAGYGDCGEHAVLLGALLRSVTIPARVILGLVYSPDRKGYYYHAWVMAWSHGAWAFVDPALGLFPALRDRVPLLIDDNGSGAIRVAPLMGRIGIRYVGKDRQGSRGRP